ncbi:MAG: phenylalanine--tRNA ligase subunit alpha [Clostridia bacterium]|nr:phenylalanine--tRNA ligase subunit alpha [Clostridia bacterium]
MLNDKIKQLVETCIARISNIDEMSANDLQKIKSESLGKNSELQNMLKSMRDLSPEERPAFGQLVNEARKTLESAFAEAEAKMKEKVLNEKLQKETVDITLPYQSVSCEERGHLHPVNLVANEIMDIFKGLGFEVLEGPEIETDYYCFEALNIPKNHPARDAQDTFYIAEDIVLRTHTSPNQVRVMEKKQPPIKMLCPGKVYRSDDDASHSPMFHQIEGLVVDKNVTLCDLMGTLETFAQSLFNEQTKARFRPSFFPFTEPSVEVDLTCSNCGGKGCKLCKGTGWIEVLGAGMVNPKVLENCGIDSTKYTGYAFGMGLERIAMIKYGIPNIKLFFENDVRFLKQFR